MKRKTYNNIGKMMVFMGAGFLMGCSSSSPNSPAEPSVMNLTGLYRAASLNGEISSVTSIEILSGEQEVGVQAKV